MLSARHVFVAAIALVIAVAAPLIAVAATRGFWLDAAHAPAPATPTNVVASGSWDGRVWSLTAYRTNADEVCLAFTPGGAANTSGAGAAASCARVGVARGVESSRALTYLVGHPPNFPDYIVGATVLTAARVNIEFSNNQTRSVAPFEVAGFRLKFFVHRLSCDIAVRTVTAVDADRRILDAMRPLDRIPARCD